MTEPRVEIRGFTFVREAGNLNRSLARVFGHPEPALLQWLTLFAIAAVCFLLAERVPFLQSFPDALTLPVQKWFNLAMEWFVALFGPAFTVLSAILGWVMRAVQDALLATPWLVIVAALSMLVLLIGNLRVALITVAALLYMALIGYWNESMRTLALVVLSIPLSALTGFALGTIAFLSPRAERIVQPLLSFMQTIPAFAYLIPALILLGFGPVVGLFVAIVYASPPFARNLLLGLKRVPRDTIEAGITSGATPVQLFWQVRIRSSTNAILIGLNQTTMAALNMVIIASMIGSSADIGWEVLSTMRKAQFGESLLAGVVIVLMAIAMDRATKAFAYRMGQPRSIQGDRMRRARLIRGALVCGAMIAFTVVLTLIWPSFIRFPDAWVINAAPSLNTGLNSFITAFSTEIEQIKRLIAYFFMMPLRLGLQQTITPFTWGIEFTPLLKGFYIMLGGGLAAACLAAGRWRLAVTVVCVFTVAYFGFARIPWIVIVGAIALLAWQTGGVASMLPCLAGLGFILVSGLWPQAVLSIYLCTAAVIISFFAGVLIGIAAARSDAISTAIRPINDALQTMPLFVFLIPVLMIFGIGEFTALVAIVMYAIVPAIRYTEHGLRHLPAAPVEAAVAMGCTTRQRLFNVELPLALPEIMLGLNQTIMFALAMLVIAALVGTSGLGQTIYSSLSEANFGAGITAGLGMANIALIADRIIQSWARQRKKALGL